MFVRPKAYSFVCNQLLVYKEFAGELQIKTIYKR